VLLASYVSFPTEMPVELRQMPRRTFIAGYARVARRVGLAVPEGVSRWPQVHESQTRDDGNDWRFLTSVVRSPAPVATVLLASRRRTSRGSDEGNFEVAGRPLVDCGRMEWR